MVPSGGPRGVSVLCSLPYGCITPISASSLSHHLLWPAPPESHPGNPGHFMYLKSLNYIFRVSFAIESGIQRFQGLGCDQSLGATIKLPHQLILDIDPGFILEYAWKGEVSTVGSVRLSELPVEGNGWYSCWRVGRRQAQSSNNTQPLPQAPLGQAL